MPKLPILKTREVIKKLENLGFIATRQKGSHKFFFHPQTKKATVVPVHVKDVGRGLLRKIIRDTDVTTDKFIKS